MSFLDQLPWRRKEKTKKTLRLRRTISVDAPEPSIEFLFEWITPEGAEPVRVLPLSKIEIDQGEIPPDVDLQYQILTNHSFDDVVHTSPGAYQLPLEQVLAIEEEDREILGLNTSTGWKLDIDVKQVIGKGKNPLALRWTAPDGTYNPDPDQFVLVPCGFYEPQRDKLHVLPAELLKIRETVDAAQGKINDVADEYQVLGELQQLFEEARKSPDFLDTLRRGGQLENEDYIAPTTVKIDIRQTEDGLEIRPIVDGFDSFDDAKNLIEASERKRLFTRDTMTSRGKRKVRVALPPQVRREVTRIRRRRHIPREKIREFVRDPYGYLQPPEEQTRERRQRARELGITEDEVAELEETEEVMDLSSVPDRLAELRLEDYGDRVIGFAETEPQKLRPGTRKGLELEDHWPEKEATQNTASADTHTEAPQHETRSDETEAPGEALPNNIVLLTADNDDELKYQLKLTDELRRQFDELGSPSLLSATLYPHQEIGYAWLRNLSDLHSDKGAGGLLADDMGLGKTIQVIGLFAHLKSADALGPSLLVVPKTVIRNWKSEIQRFCPVITDIYEYIGSNRRQNLDFLRQHDVIITTYDTLRIDQLLLGKLPFKVMVCDEAQYIKNYTTGRASACRGMNAQLRISLTATPVENSLDELWSIVDYSQPGHLGSLTEFRNTYSKLIEGDDLPAAQMASRALQEKLSAHYLRRTKEDELGDTLPEKIPTRVELQLTDLQLSLYQQIKSWYARQEGRGSALGAIEALLRVCAHPLALTEKAAREMGLDFAGSLLGVRSRAREIIAQSAKTRYVFEQLDDIKEANEKAIIFTRYRSLQLLLQPLIEETMGIRPHIINGEVAGGKRHELIEAFNHGNGFDVIIMSAGAAGVGVNVTGANHVIHITREWNPAKENQATDRAYRIGQTRDVYVHTPIATHSAFDTIDIKLDNLLSAKLDLARQVIRPSDSLEIGTRELEDCLTN